MRFFAKTYKPGMGKVLEKPNVKTEVSILYHDFRERAQEPYTFDSTTITHMMKPDGMLC